MRRRLSFPNVPGSRVLPFALVLLSLADPARAVNWRGRPGGGGFLVTEVGYAYRTRDHPAATPSSRGGQRWLLTGEAGYMENVHPRWAVGGTVYAGLDDNGNRFGLGPRARLWLNPRSSGVPVSLDVTPTVLVGGDRSRFTSAFPALSVSAALNVGDLVALTVRVEGNRLGERPEFPADRYPPGTKEGTDWAWYYGVRFGSFIAVGGGAAALVVAIIALSSWAGY